VDTDRGNMLTAELVAKYPDRFRGYWGVNPNYPDRIERDLARFEDFSGFVGFKFLSDYHKVAISDQRYAPVLEYAQERELPILMHTWGHSGFDGPDLVEKVAQKYPDVTILMGHAGYGQWDKAIQVARDHPNVYLELTAAYSVRGAIEAMVKGAGSAKITFGTDLPWFDPHYGIGCVLFARIAEEDRHNILHRNAERLFGI
jgi:predicted TIM-barrel fold metal-dependent hydrolase